MHLEQPADESKIADRRPMEVDVLECFACSAGAFIFSWRENWGVSGVAGGSCLFFKKTSGLLLILQAKSCLGRAADKRAPSRATPNCLINFLRE